MSEWKLVPVEPTAKMLGAVVSSMDEFMMGSDAEKQYREDWAAMLAAAPKPPHEVLTNEDANEIQNWKGMDGAIAFHLIERHANGWGDVGLMMKAWLVANGDKP